MSSANLPTRDRILRACLDLMERGSRSRMSDIAKAAGVSRQALYLHFNSRADLLVEATFYLDRLHDTDARLAPSRRAETGRDRLTEFLSAWADYLPVVHPTLQALTAMSAQDEEAAAALRQRMTDLHEGCEAAIAALNRDGDLAPGLTVDDASDLLWALCQVELWHRLTSVCGWTQETYRSHLINSARRLFVSSE